MVRIPRLLIGAPTSSSGKTTVTIGLLAALRARGLAVAPSKVGPDYIDPGYHALAAGRPGRNLDPHLCGEDLIAPLFAHGARDADLAITEGVMGLFDGRLGTGGFGSSAHVARLLDSPVVLVVDAAHTSRTAAAIVHGLATYDARIRVGGVILNKVGSPRAVAELRTAVGELGLPVLGAVPRTADVSVPSRHLGLIPALEREDALAEVTAAGEALAAHVDLEAVLALAATAPDLEVTPWSPAAVVTPVAGRPRVAVASGRAFTFRYAETVELLEAAGCEVVEFDPMRDPHLPEGVSGLYIGGGFPEVHAASLSENAALRAEIAAAVAAGMPTVAECAGLLYLAESLDDVPMVGAVPLRARMAGRLTLRYLREPFAGESVIVRAGEDVSYHEFHKTATEPAVDVLTPTLHASYRHVHWAGHPEQAQRFAEAAAGWDSWLRYERGRHDLQAQPAESPQALEPNVPVLEPVERTTTDWLRYERGRHDLQAQPATTSPVLEPNQPVLEPNQPVLEPNQPVLEPVERTSPEIDLLHHGDADLSPGLLDLAVNVRGPAPSWLLEAIQNTDLTAYPNPAEARDALAGRHAVRPTAVLPTAGAAEAFTLVARALNPRKAVVVHPQFTEPEAALTRAGVPVQRVILPPPFALDPAAIPDDADLVVIGNPTNPTGILHSATTIRQFLAPGRTLLVDEAFMDFTPGEAESLAGETEGLLVVRSITKMWGLAGLRAGYVVGDPALIGRLEAQQPPWSVSSPALRALVECSRPEAVAQAHQFAVEIAAERDWLLTQLRERGFTVHGTPSTPFVLLDTDDPNVRTHLANAGIAARRGETFPGLGRRWVRLAVRDRAASQSVLGALGGDQNLEPSDHKYLHPTQTPPVFTNAVRIPQKS